MTREEAMEFIAQSVKSDVDMALVADAIKVLEQESTTKNCRTCRNFGSHHGICEICKDNKCWTEKEPTTKNDLAVDCIDRAELLKAMDTWDKFGYTAQYGLERLDKDDKGFVPYVKYDDMVNCIKGMPSVIPYLPSVTPQEPRWIPVSEKLPNDRDWYLGIFKEPDTGWINPLPFICDYVGKETKATTKEFWILRGFTDRDVRDCDYYFNLECVAWMPLPQQYEPQESEEI